MKISETSCMQHSTVMFIPDEVVEELPEKRLKTDSDRKVNENRDVFFMLEGNKRVTINMYKGSLYVDIRFFYEKAGQMLPTKKGDNHIDKQIDR